MTTMDSHDPFFTCKWVRRMFLHLPSIWSAENSVCHVETHKTCTIRRGTFTKYTKTEEWIKMYKYGHKLVFFGWNDYFLGFFFCWQKPTVKIIEMWKIFFLNCAFFCQPIKVAQKSLGSRKWVMPINSKFWAYLVSTYPNPYHKTRGEKTQK